MIVGYFKTQKCQLEVKRVLEVAKLFFPSVMANVNTSKAKKNIILGFQKLNEMSHHQVL